MRIRKRQDICCTECKTINSRTIEGIQYNLKRNGQYICHKCKTKICGKQGIYTRDSQKLLQQTKKLWENKEYRKNVINSNKITHTKLSVRMEKSERTKKLWKKKEYAKSISDAVKKKFIEDKTYKTRMSTSLKKRYQEDPQYKEKIVKYLLRNPKISTQQNTLYSILDDLNITYQKEYYIGWYPYDCYIPKQRQMNNPIIIEVQGDFWHSLPKRISQDKAKATYLKEYFKDYDLKYIWEHEFDNKERVINLLRYWLNLSKPEQIEYKFQDIKITTIDPKTAEIFISKYHYAGRIGRSGINIGYYINDILIAVCVFAYPVRKEVATKQGYQYKQVLELTRFAIHPSYQKKNLASFCIGKAIKIINKERPEIKCLVSFADSTYNHDGIIYKASNWSFDGIVSPDYWYADKDGYVCHKKTLWNKANGLKMTEREYCDKYGYRKVLGNEKKRYVYLFDNQR